MSTLASSAVIVSSTTSKEREETASSSDQVSCTQQSSQPSQPHPLNRTYIPTQILPAHPLSPLSTSLPQPSSLNHELDSIPNTPTITDLDPNTKKDDNDNDSISDHHRHHHHKNNNNKNSTKDNYDNNDTDNPFDTLISSLLSTLGPSAGLTTNATNPTTLMFQMSAYTSLNHEHDWARYALADPSRAYTRNLVHSGNGMANVLILVWNPGRGSGVHDHAGAHCIMKVLKGTLMERVFRIPGEGCASSCSCSSCSCSSASCSSSATASSSNSGSDLKSNSRFQHSTNGNNNDDDTGTDTDTDNERSGEKEDETKGKLIQISQKLYPTDSVAYIADTIGLHQISNASDTEIAVSLHMYTPPHAATFGFHVFDEETGRKRHVKQGGFFSEMGKKVRVKVAGH